MNKPVQVTVQLSAEDAADLQARVERGEFASLDEGVAAELAELNYRRAAEIVGGSEKLEALLDALEESDEYERLAEGRGEPPAGVAEDVEAVRLSIKTSIAENDYEDAEGVFGQLRKRFGEGQG
ncbi:hypothetical protein [Caulobacter sp.]|jgi:Arc/MetJ-type ribon-helix-helix transcriptional regulator|uniref:hypothetical protein n=1 Tax=Caulobacter sp. TaxID=78 RepID=UPI00180A35DF